MVKSPVSPAAALLGLLAGLAAARADRPAPAPAPAGGLDGWGFEAPPQWKVTRGAGAVTLTGGTCALVLVPFRPAVGAIDQDVDAVFAAAFQGWTVQNDNGARYARMSRGVSADGWEYMQVRAYLHRGASRSDGEERLGLVFIARVGDRNAIVVGTRASSEHDDTLAVATDRAQCLDEHKSTDWPRFFHSLKLEGGKPQPGALARSLAGKWRATSSTVSVGYAFTPGGRYARASGSAQYDRIDSETVKTTTRASFGEGSWKLVGSELTMITDKDKGGRDLARVRLQADWEYGAWTQHLYLLKTANGADYELVLARDE